MPLQERPAKERLAQDYFAVGQRPREVLLHPDGAKVWSRGRIPLTRRHWLKWRSRHNPKTWARERRLEDKRPLWWVLGLGAVLLATPFLSDQFVSLASIFCIFSAINVIWALIVGTAGIFSLATMAVVGLCGYAAAAANVYLGIPWPLLMPLGAVVGLVIGGFLALPSTRLDGLYYALLTLGVAEICRVFISQIKELAPTNSSINGIDSFIPADWMLQRPGLLLGFFAAFLLLLAALLMYRLIDSERLGLLLQAAREDEAFSEAAGIDYRRARLWVFVLSSSALGAIGAFYAMFYRSISLAVFSLDQLMLLFAMMVIGGLGRSEGAVIGTAIVVIIDKGMIGLGPLRIILIAIVMVAVTLTAHNGLTGVRDQFRGFRNRKKSERRAVRTEKGGEVMPEEATEMTDKQEIYYRRFDKRLRDQLKTFVNPELIAEHKAKPLGQHSDELDRLLNYFRRGPMLEKYAILQVGPLAQATYRVMAFSGVHGQPPRPVDDKEYGQLDEAYHAVFLLRINDLLES